MSMIECDVLWRRRLSHSSGVFEIAEASGVQQGTKIVLHLKDDCKEFSAEDRVKGKNCWILFRSQVRTA